MRFFINYRKRLVVIFIILPMMLATSFLVYQSWKLASPTRKKLKDYHVTWINQQAENGISIEQTVCLDGKVPTFVIEPTGILGERGEIIRKQLTERGGTPISIEQLTNQRASHTILILHGRNGRKEDCLTVSERLCALGFRCIVIDMPAHGDNTVETVQFGATEWEQDLPYNILLECSQKYNFSPAKASLWGMSMGGSFVNSALADKEHGTHWKSAVLICTFDRLDLVITEQTTSLISLCISNITQLFGGADLKEVNPAAWVKDVKTPVMLVHGDQDSLIAHERGKSLYNSYASPNKRWLEVPGGTHRSVLSTSMPLYVEMAAWFLEN